MELLSILYLIIENDGVIAALIFAVCLVILYRNVNVSINIGNKNNKGK